ncbi:MAG: hypothetical protein QM820_29475 [Minicystis sp.]
MSLSACAGGTPSRRAAGSPPDSGWVDPSTPAPRASASPRPAVVERWDLDAQLEALHPAVKRARSGHLTGELEADVLAGSAGPYPQMGPETRLGPGATLVERLFEPGGAAPVAYFAMVKRPPGFAPGGGDWEYLVVSPSGQIEQRGPLPLCARCHAEAPHDRLFGAGR